MLIEKNRAFCAIVIANIAKFLRIGLSGRRSPLNRAMPSRITECWVSFRWSSLSISYKTAIKKSTRSLKAVFTIKILFRVTEKTNNENPRRMFGGGV